MEEKLIYVYDHDTNKDQLGSLFENFPTDFTDFTINCEERNLNIRVNENEKEEKDAILHQAESCHIVIAHSGDDTIWKELLDSWQELPEKSSHERILIRTGSTEGRRGLSQERYERAFALNLYPPHTQVKSDDWKKILTALVIDDTAQKITDGGCPIGLRRFFGGPLALMPAICILCQGYLALYRSLHSKLPLDCHEDVRTAFESMGWDKAFTHDNIPTGMKTLLNKSTDNSLPFKKEYWYIFNDISFSDIEGEVQAEWNSLTDNSDWGKVEALLKHIYLSAEDSDASCAPVVAGAYLALAKSLEGAS